ENRILSKEKASVKWEPETVRVNELRQAVATYYNDTFRNDNSELKPFTYENVCIVPGGRAGLTRIASVIGDAYTGYQLPDYTAYEQLLTICHRTVPISTHLDSEKQYRKKISCCYNSFEIESLFLCFSCFKRKRKVVKRHNNN
ncbi:unnamed protein product, partial [Didymodactylos carnosus]